MKAKFNFLSKEDREKLSLDDFGDPERRLFAVVNQEDIDKAPKRIVALPNHENVKSRIISIAERKGLKLPEEWAVSNSQFSTSNRNSDGIAEFELDATTATETKDGEYVLRTGKIFEAGNYPDKKFEISPEELCEAIADFKPVDLDLEHTPTILDGKLGKLEAVALGSDGWSLVGTVRLPKWLDSQLGAAERKVSATWDRMSKKLTKLALVINPRVKDAALMAAFMANEISDQIDNSSEEEIAKTIESIIEEKFGKQTWDGKSLMQNIHDMAARSGAVCVESDKKFNEAKEAGFISADEAKTIQQIHDMALRGGAMCRFVTKGSEGSAGSSYYNSKEKQDMTLEDLKEFLKLSDNTNKDTKTVENKDESAKVATPDVKDIAAVATLAAKEAVAAAKLEWDQAAELKAQESVKETKEDDAVLDTLDTSADVNNSEPSAREKELESQLNELRLKDIMREAEKFADNQIKSEKAYPAERSALVSIFAKALELSNENIKFNDGEKEVEASLADAITALYSVRKPHNLTYEEVTDLGANVLTTYSDESVNYLDEAEKQAKEFAARRKKEMARENFGN